MPPTPAPTPEHVLRAVLGPRTAAALLRTSYDAESLAKSAAEAGRDVLGLRVDAGAFAGALPLPHRAEQAVRHLATLAKARADREVLSRVQRLVVGRADDLTKARKTIRPDVLEANFEDRPTQRLPVDYTLRKLVDHGRRTMNPHLIHGAQLASMYLSTGRAPAAHVLAARDMPSHELAGHVIDAAAKLRTSSEGGAPPDWDPEKIVSDHLAQVLTPKPKKVQKAAPTPHTPPDPKGPPDRQHPERPEPPRKAPPTVQPPKQRPRGQ